MGPVQYTWFIQGPDGTSTIYVVYPITRWDQCNIRGLSNYQMGSVQYTWFIQQVVLIWKPVMCITFDIFTLQCVYFPGVYLLIVFTLCTFETALTVLSCQIHAYTFKGYTPGAVIQRCTRSMAKVCCFRWVLVIVWLTCITVRILRYCLTCSTERILRYLIDM